MRYTLGKTLGIALAALCVVSTVALAQPAAPGQTLTCTKVDASGYCIEAKAHDDQVMTVRVEDVKVSEKMTCVTLGDTTKCMKITTEKTTK
jgi:hypothetical protein